MKSRSFGVLRLVGAFLIVGAALAADPPSLADFHDTTKGHYQVLTQGGRQIGANVNWYMNEILKQYSQFFSNWSPKQSARVVVFTKWADFQGYARAETHSSGLAGYCLVKQDDQGRPFHELVTCEHDYLYRTLAHEGFHQFVAYELAGRAPTWLNEGLAQYFETATVLHNRLQTGQISRSKLLAAQSLLDKKQAPTIAELIQMDRATFYRQAGHSYPTSWALVYFLLHRENDKYSESDMRHYFTDLKLGKDSVSSFSSRFGRNSRELQEEFERYVFRLKARFD